ncbi:MAG: hypothetical protein ACE5GZ_12715 [Gammaproteobacteria bacterium]
MKRPLHIFSALFTLLAGVVWMQSAAAIPAFARETGKQCSYCHTAWPQLNAKGRQFKEQGYRLANQLNEDINLLDLIETFPIAGAVVSRPEDKKDNGDSKLRALHELEIWLAGPIGKRFSGFAEFEAEDEDGFGAVAAHGNAAYHFNRYLNVRAGFQNIFWDDPYGLLNITFNMTGPIRPAFLDNSFGGGESKLRKSRQMVSLYGRLFNDKLFYSLAYADNAEDLEGEDPRTYMGRAAFDITKDIHIGGFYMEGSQGSVKNPAALTIAAGLPAVTPASTTPGTDYQRYGVDAQLDYKQFRLQGVYMHAQDDLNDGTGNKDNDFFTLQSMYTFTNKNGSPTWVPLIRYDRFEQKDGKNDFDELTAQLNYYISENSKIFAQFWTQLNTPAGDEKNDRFTLQFQIAF